MLRTEREGGREEGRKGGRKEGRKEGGREEGRDEGRRGKKEDGADYHLDAANWFFYIHVPYLSRTLHPLCPSAPQCLLGVCHCPHCCFQMCHPTQPYLERQGGKGGEGGEREGGMEVGVRQNEEWMERRES